MKGTDVERPKILRRTRDPGSDLHPMAHKTGQLTKYYNSIAEAAKAEGVYYAAICARCRKESTIRGWTWGYEND